MELIYNEIYKKINHIYFFYIMKIEKKYTEVYFF